MSRLPLSRLVAVFVALATLALVSLAYSRSSLLGDPFGIKNIIAKALPGARAAQSSDITPEGLQQIAALIAEKESRTPEQRKISSALLQAVRESRGQQMAAGVSLEPSNIKADSAGLALVDITAAVTDTLIANIKQLGGEIIFPSAEYKAIRARIPLSSVETIAGYPEVTFIRSAALAKTNSMSGLAADRGTAASTGLLNSPSPFAVNPPRRLSFAERAANVRVKLAGFLAIRAGTAAPFVGKVTSQGDKAHQADTAKAQYGFAGEGIRIGVMSDSFNYLGGLAADIAGGDLPGPGNPFGNTTPVTVVQDLPIPNGIIAGSDEGRAMMQIVHDLAPKAQLFFASAFISEAGFATNIKRLRDAPNNGDIVIDDVSYSDEGVFQDSIIALAVNYVTNSGGMYFSSAGNEGSVLRATASAWEGDFNDAGSTYVVPGNSKSGTIHNFGTVGTPVNGNILLSSSGFVYSLDWSDPLGASTNDYDLFVVNTAGTTVKAASTNVQAGTIDPHEEIGATAFTRATGDRLVIFKSSAAAVRALSLNAEGGRLTVPTVGNTHGHSCAADAFGVAAAAATAANTTSGVFTSASRVETFSSDGPRRKFYNPDGSQITPGNILFATSGGFVFQKPEITAADNVTTSGNNLGGGLTQFSGTSAAAPHAGAIAALIKSAKPSLTLAQIRAILTTAVIDIETAGVDAATGFGIVNANAAVLAAMTQQADLTVGTTTTTEGTPSNSNTVVEPGEYANVVVQLVNPSLTAATGVNATLTSVTAGVTIIQGSASYGTISAGGNASNTGTPFVVGISPSFPCGSPISLMVTATLTNGSPVGSTFSVTIGGALTPLVPTISGTLSLTPPTGAGFTSVGGTKTGTLARNTIQATCAAPKAAPLSGTGFSATTGGRYAAFTFTNPRTTAQCVSITATSGSANNLQTATFDNNGFNAATSLSAGTNYLADSGTRAASMAYSFVIPGSQSFTVVIYDATTGGTAGATTYTLTVSLSTCAATGACTPVTITNGSIAGGSTGSPYTQSFSATGGSSSYTFSLTGNLPAGLSFAGNTLSGTPTQAGSFSITINATDPTCPGGAANFTLVIAGIIPTSVTATAGNGQSTVPSTAFPTALQATVRDGANNPLSGVNVMFAAPSSGASGTFAGGATTVTVVSNASGLATAPAFTANATQGSYAVTATVNGVATPATFNLSNTCPGSFVVTTNADSGAGSLRTMIQTACPGATITFDPSVTGTITLTTGELMISKSLTITGPGANVLAISTNHLTRIFNIAPGAGNIVNVTGLTVKDGSTKPDGTDFYGGGGVFILNGTVNLTGCVVTGCSATPSGNPDGGGIDNEGGVVTIDRCSITNNTVTNNVASNGAFYFGGGIFSEGAGSSMTITNSTITGNTCGPFGNGGGLAFFTNVTMTNCTVFGNSANNGGNILRGGGTLTFKNNIIAGGMLTGINGTGIDINGTGFSSQDYNLIQTTTGGTITGTTTHNITGVSPNLLALGNYGGPTPTLLPAPASPVINVGDVALVSGTDQRGLSRLVGSQADIGAVEVNYALAATGGSPQSTIINTNFASPLQATVTESGNAVNGVTVTYTAPGSGASGLFGASLTGTGTTNAGGIANSPTFTANGATGTYSVTGSIGAAFTTVNFNLTNTGTPASITATAGTPQNTPAGQAFATALQATVLDAGGTPVFGVTVTFTVPNSGPSGTFPGNVISANAVTNINGQATAPTLTANSTGGTFTANASVTGVATPAAFSLTVCAITCPSNIVKSTDPNQCSAIVTYTTPTTSAGCGTVSCSPASGSAFQKGTTTVTCTLTPGNVTCSFTVTVNDTQAPSITCPANVTHGTDPNQCSAVVTFAAPTVSDNCPSVGTPTCTPASGSTFQKGTTTVNCTVSDASSNQASCSFTVTVNDTQNPSITCPANIVKSTDPNQCSAVVTFATTTTDNCPAVTTACTPPSGSTFAKGTTTVNCTATDSSNNTASCSFTVTVNDTQAPSITCPANVSVPAAQGLCSAVVAYAAPTVGDNCPGVGAPTCTPPSGSTFPKGTTTVNCSVRDAANNQSNCSFGVTVVDTQPPTITCPGDIITATVNPGDSTVAVSFAATAADNCPGVGVACVPASGSQFARGTTTVTCTATDTSNNHASCSFTVRVFDFVIVDDTNGKILRFNSLTGDYDFLDCRKGTSLSGHGVVTPNGCKTDLKDTGPDSKHPDRNVAASTNSCTKVGTATIVYAAVTHTLSDSNLSNNFAKCP